MPDSPDQSWTSNRLAALARATERSIFPSSAERSPSRPEVLAPQIEGYEVLCLIGSGGMGSVWLARQGNEDFAIKILHVSWTGDADATARFESEIDSLATLDHPNIVKLLDAGETADRRLFLATEHVPGCDLHQLLRGGMIPTDRAIGIFRKVAAAISHAHEHGLIHRDLKPANILVGAGDLVKVTDFGLAKSSAESVTREADAFGTPYYLAPELTRSASAATPASDVYSLGVLLYELLSGKLPLGSYTPLSSFGLDRRLDPVIKRALSDDPSTRTASVAVFLAEIERIWQSRSIRSRWKRRAPWLAAGALLLLGPLAGIWWSEIGRKPIRRHFPPADQAARDKPWVNSLGMSFIPVEGSDVLFSVYETRNAELQPFRKVEQSMLPSWRLSESSSIPRSRPVMGLQGRENSGQDLAEKPDQPAQGVSWQDTQFFCNWLTLQERNEGRLTNDQYYRLPTDKEWNLAAGGNDAFPAAPVGNFAGPEARTARWPASYPTRDQSDPFPEVAPVGSFPPSATGLFDLAGNALEWVDDGLPTADSEEAASQRVSHLLRGGSWATAGPEDDQRFKARPNKRRMDYGFRCVLVIREEPGKAADLKK